MSAAPRYLALSGGVGGAKLASGLAQVLPTGALIVAVNTGDDFRHLGLTICPDLDTVLYTLAGLANREQGWGREGESWQVLDELGRLGGDTWFRLGDRDLALHLLRSQLLGQGLTLSQAITEMANRLSIHTEVAPLSDDPVRTLVETDQGLLEFQDYFVRRHCAPAVKALHFDGAAQAVLAPAIRRALDDPALAGVILCPSNPYLSIAPMLAVPELRQRLRQLQVPVIAVSPIVGGEAIKGPTAKIMRELGLQPSAVAISELYGDFLDLTVVDIQDAALATGDHFAVAPIVMKTIEDRVDLARRCLALVGHKH
ncbi:MAG: domain, 2-phospho-L-lactate transferase 2 [Nevskia sp.]|nr:domain, 2-phospho-L-lactate transferase 2 [Nevskia sp.]